MDLSAKLSVLKENPYFSSLPSVEARELVARLRERRYRTGDMIFRRGNRCEGLFIVLRGRVRTSITSIDGREQVLKVFGPGRGRIRIADVDALSVWMSSSQGSVRGACSDEPVEPTVRAWNV